MILVASQLPQAVNDHLQNLPGIRLEPIPADQYEGIGGAEVLIAVPPLSGSQPALTRPAGWPFALQWVQLSSVGIDSYPRWVFDVRQVTCARGMSGNSLAEFALAQIFAAEKNMPDIWIDSQQQWTRRRLGMVDGRTLGIFGYGAIGAALSVKASALGMKVLVARASARSIDCDGVERVDGIAELVGRSDHLVLAAPATSETVGIVDRTLLKQAKPGLHLINLARGALINDDALLHALDMGWLSLASLDVTTPEPLTDGHPFYRHPKVRLSPHVSASTPESLTNLVNRIGDNLDRYQRGMPLSDHVTSAHSY